LLIILAEIHNYNCVLDADETMWSFEAVYRPCVWICRARIEEEYARSIERLNKNVEYPAEIG